MRIYQVDAFASQPFAGNPACVCLLEESRPDEWLQAVAGEMNLSETAFVRPGAAEFGLRWFTPKREVSLCGHATLATAHILWEQGYLPSGEEARFTTLSGLLTARQDGKAIEMDFPARSLSPAEGHAALNAALGVEPCQTARSSSAKGDTYLVELASEAAVRAVAPDFAALLATGIRATIATGPSQSPEYDFVSRFFAPALGIDEDPATGSAHCYLAPYWGARLGKTLLVGLQVSRRGGVVGCRWQGERVALRGQAVTVLRGELLA